MAFPWLVSFFNPPRDYFSIGFTSAISNVVRYDGQNNHEIDLVIASIYLDWPAGNDALFNFLVDGTAIWSGEDLTPPTFVDSGWVNTVDDRTVFAKTSFRLEALFGLSAAGSGYELILTFTNGWQFTVVT